MKKIMILALLFPAMAYGFAKTPWKPPTVDVKKQRLIVESENGEVVRTFPILEVDVDNETLTKTGRSPEDVLKEAAESAVAIEGCDTRCFGDVLTLTEQSVKNPGGPVDRAMDAMKYVDLRGNDAVVVDNTVYHVVDIVGEDAERSQGALTYASIISPHWNDPTAQKKIPEVSETWAAESQRRGDTIIGTMQAFDEGPEEAGQREEDIKTECQAPAVG